MDSKKFDLLDFDELYFHTISLDRNIEGIRYSEAKKGVFRITEELLKCTNIKESDIVLRMIREQYGSDTDDLLVKWYSRKKFIKEGCFMYMWDECSFDFMYRWIPNKIQNMQSDGWEFFFFEQYNTGLEIYQNRTLNSVG